jgi:hypothetical protein
MTKEALKLALEYIQAVPDDRYNAEHIDRDALITAIKEALAQTQEPVAWRAPNWGHSADEYVYRDFDDPVIGVDGKPSSNNEPLYTHPPQRTWVGLTDDERFKVADHSDCFEDVVDAIEAKLKEKNT